MNRLQLVNSLKNKVGNRSAADLTTTVGQTGENFAFVDYIDAAWNDIQGRHQDWGWKRASTSFTTILNQATYTPAQAGTTNFGMWDWRTFRNYLTATGTDSEIFMGWIDYEDWRNLYQFSSNRTAASQPYLITITPAKAIGLGPVPLAGYTVTGDYFTAPIDMTLDADIPSLPTHYHLAIVYRAMMFYGVEEAATEIYQDGEKEFNRMMNRIENDYLPELEMGCPLI